jgi:subtilisin family serine protease
MTATIRSARRAPAPGRVVRAAIAGWLAAASIGDAQPRAPHDAWLPDDPLFARQWHLENTGQGGTVVDADVDATEAWRYTRGSPGIVIAVLDDGVQLDHPDLAANIAQPGADFTVLPPRADASPRSAADRHGTSVAGIVAARGDNSLGVAGICPLCTILPVRVHGASNAGMAAAFRYAVEQGADVITNSWGYPLSEIDAAVVDAIDAAALTGRGGLGTLVVFGMTNDVVDNCDGSSTDVSALDRVVAVGVSDHNDRIGGSGYGDCMDLVAPAKPMRRDTIGIATTDRTGIDGHAPGDYHLRFGGTSAAAPLVAGIAGLLYSLNPELTRADVERILKHTADKIDVEAAAYDAAGFSRRAGHGRVNAARALTPQAAIRVAPPEVVAGEPFTVIVTASAPFGLETVSWSGSAARVDASRFRPADGAAFRIETWHGVVIDRPGVFVLSADARDVRHDRPVDGYPHSTAQAGSHATTSIVVRSR